MRDLLMAKYVTEQPSALQRLLQDGQSAGLDVAAANVARVSPRKVWMVGAGTSMYAGAVAARYWRTNARVDAEAISSLELLQDVPDWQLGPGTLVVGISQSGSTVVLTRAIARARQLGSHTVAVTAVPGSDLANAAHDAVLSLTGEEDVFAKTKGFTTTALAACLLGHKWATSAGRISPDSALSASVGLATLPEMVQSVVESSQRLMPELTSRFVGVAGMFVVGMGTLLPAAYEGSLKLLEVAKLPVIGRDIEEVQHGYFNAIGPETGIVLLTSVAQQVDRVSPFLDAVRHVGAPVVVVAEGDQGPADLRLPVNPCPELSPLLGAIPLQVMAYEVARLRGVDPNRTRYPELYAVMKTKSIYQ